MDSNRDPAAHCLADQLERGFRGGAWHGPSLMEVLVGVDADLAGWRPGPEIHAIAEVVAHLTFWLDDARRQVLGEARRPGGEGADWGLQGPVSEPTWQACRTALEEAHCGLHAAVQQVSATRLDEALAGSESSLRGLVLGILQHNAYHAGQMSLLRRLRGRL